MPNNNWFNVVRLGLYSLAVISLFGCESLGYYSQAFQGQMDLISAKRPIDDVLADPTTSDRTKAKLHLVREARQFASNELALPNNESYSEYADLKRPYALWNVLATPEFSLQPKTWCYLIVGCLSYRGYFDKKEAYHLAEALAADGYDTSVGGVSAYSTLGWFDDPVLNTIINRADHWLVALLFHELAHQVVYVDDDTMFNESFATAVEIEGMRLWLKHRSDTERFEAYQQGRMRKRDFVVMLRNTYGQLSELYQQPLEPASMRERKAQIILELKQTYEKIKNEKWDAYDGYDDWFNQPLNNAHLIGVSLYHDLVAAFQGLLAAKQYDFAAFYAEVKELAKLKKQERITRLKGFESAQ